MAGSWPSWWDWELELTPHLLRRMRDRGFSETELRLMLERATGYHSDVEAGRYVIETDHEERPWAVIVEPELVEKVLIVVTAYPVD